MVYDNRQTTVGCREALKSAFLVIYSMMFGPVTMLILFYFRKKKKNHINQ